MSHILDNPFYNALISKNQELSDGDEQVRVLHIDVGPFVGMNEISQRNFDQLYNMIPDNRVIVVVTKDEIEISDNWNIIRNMRLYQMVCNNLQVRVPLNHILTMLNESHVPLMVELTALTNPGPFGERTIKFGDYFGVFADGILVAMAGIRASVGPYREVSAVCTHPDYVGKGYATALILRVMNLIVEQGCIPYLHVRKDNINAIKVYQRLGFVSRQEMVFNIIQKAV
jgi:predicted GNAT family acetyltransferase